MQAMEANSRDQELAEALEQQRVTGEILKAIANSSTDPAPIFETIVTSATRLCQASFAFVMLNEGGHLVLAARTECTPEFAAFLQGGKPPNRATTTGRAALERRPVQVLDFLAEPGTLVTEAHRAESVRTVLAVPMCRGDRLVGVMSVWRREVRAFSERQIKLLETFANQAVIALENVRLFQEAQGRNRELAEALEHQTATSEVLKLISRSTFELEPVLRSLVEYATKLCAAEQGFIFRRDDDGYRLAVAYRAPADFREWRQADAIQPGDGTMVGRVALEGRAIQIVDTQTDAEWLAAHRDAPGIEGVRTLLGVPMLRENVPIGVIALWRTAVQPFTDKQIELITTFADQAVIAIENVRLFRELETRNKDIAEALEKQTATAEILRAISASPTDPQPVFEAIVRNALTLCGSLFANVFRYDGELLHYVASHNTGPGYVELLREKYPMRPDRSQVSGRVLLSGSVVRLEDARSDPDYDQRFPTAMGWRRVLGVPMLRDGKPLGAIVVAWSDAGPIPKAQEELLCTFADQAVIAIENVRLFRELETRNEEVTEALQQQTATSEVLRIISSSPTDVQPVFEMIAKNAVTLCDGQFSGVFTFDGELVRLLAFRNLSTQGAEVYRQAFPRPASRDSAIGRAIASREIVQIPDVLEDPEYELRDLARAGTMRCIIAVPMLRDGNPIGGIVVWRSRPELFTQNQIQLVATFADQAVIAIENVRLFDELKTRSSELQEALEYQTATGDVLNVISRSPTQLQPVLDVIVSTAARLCSAEFSFVARYSDGVLRMVAAIRVEDEQLSYLAKPIGIDRGSVSGRVVLDKKTIHVPDVLADPEFDRFEWQRIGKQRTVLGVPLLRENTLIGVIILARTSVSPFSEKQIELVTTFADQAVIAIENARLFDEIQEKTRQLEIADKYKSHFIASASHDLRQPLHALNLFVAQLQAEADPAERGRLLSRIGAAVSSMNELFGALLDMTKLDAGILEAHLTEFPVGRMFERIETTFAVAAREKRLGLRILPSSAWVRSDSILLERMLLNLVSNAVRYTARGGILIGCRRRGTDLRIDVCDTGPGIPEDQRSKIFAEFYQFERATADHRGGAGLGLGLAIVDRLGRLLRHSVELNSRLGHGSRFSIFVPLVAARTDIADVPISPDAVSDPARGKFVVVVDDDPLVLEGMSGILRNWGCTVVTGDTPEAVLPKVGPQRNKPDLIISDYRLSNGETGIAAIEKLRDALDATIPAFLISGDTAPERLRDARNKGLYLLHKPVAPMALRAMLNGLLKPRGEGAPSQAAISGASRRPSRGGARDRARPPR